MITLNAEIELDIEKNATILEATSNAADVNGNTDLSSVINKFADTPISIIGNFCVITVKTNIPTTSLILTFDTANNAYPESIIIDGEEYISKGVTFKTDMLEYSATHTVKILGWNGVAPIKIYGIQTRLYEWWKINRRSIISLETNFETRDDYSTPSYGIISSNGSADFTDPTGFWLSMIKQKKLYHNVGNKISIKVNDNLAKSEALVAERFINEATYNSSSKTVSIGFADLLESLQDIDVPARLNYRKSEEQAEGDVSGLDLYEFVKEQTIGFGFEFEELDEETYDFLRRCAFYYAPLEEGTLWSRWDTLCQIFALHIYASPTNKIVVKHAI